jgi:heme/copper-type cytochrome/quinol oxidase subunit 4
VTLDWVDWAFGAASILVVLSGRLAEPQRRSHAYKVGVILLASWAVTAFTHASMSDPEAYRVYPVLDVAVAAFTFALWRRNRYFSTAAVVVLASIQCLMHLMFRLSHDLSDNNQQGYIAVLNATFAMQLISAGSLGLYDGCGHDLRDHLLGLGASLRRRRDLARQRTYSPGPRREE